MPTCNVQNKMLKKKYNSAQNESSWSKHIKTRVKEIVAKRSKTEQNITEHTMIWRLAKVISWPKLKKSCTPIMYRR